MSVRSTSPALIAHVLAGLLCCIQVGAASASEKAASTEAAFNEAMEQYRDSRWPAAYAGFAALADRGHAESARIALLMLRYGGRLYGHEWRASQPQTNLWMKLAVQRMQQLLAEPGD